jgi:hypothetical protein
MGFYQVSPFGWCFSLPMTLREGKSAGLSGKKMRDFGALKRKIEGSLEL